MKIQYILGLRASEISNLSIRDINISNTPQFYNHKKFRKISTNNTVKITGKGGLVRFIPIQDRFLPYLEQIKEFYSCRGIDKPYN